MKNEQKGGWPFIGHDNIGHFLEKSVRNGKLSHAYGFFGPGMAGKRKLAQAFVQAVLCEKKTGIPCGICIHCVRVRNKTHQDVFCVFRDGEEKNIGIEKIREMQGILALTPAASSHQIAVVFDAHALSLEAQNSMLKILEEPPRSAIIILITDRWENLLPTLRSRLLGIKLSIIATKDIVEYLRKNYHNLSSGQITKIAEFSFGRIEKANELAENNAALESLEEEYGKAVGFLTSARGGRLRILAEIFEKNAPFLEQQSKGIVLAQNILAMIDWILRDKLSIKPMPLGNIGSNADLTIESLGKFAAKLCAVIELLRKNVTPRLVFEQLIWEI